MRRSSILLFALPLALPACGGNDDGFPTLGPIDGGVLDALPAPDAKLPAPVTLETTACTASSPTLGPDITNALRSVATLESRAILTLNDSIRSMKLDSDGCPGEPITTFGTNGSVALDASSAVPLPGGRALVAAIEGTTLLDSTGTGIGACENNGGVLIARSLQATAEGKVVAALSKAPITLLTTNVSSPNCSAEAVALTPEPFAIAIVAIARAQGFVTVQQATMSSPLVVARYAADGSLRASSSAYASSPAAKLCSATGLVDTPAGVFVTDTACRRAVLFDAEDLHAVAETHFVDVPRGAALTPGEKSVLIGVVRSVENGALATFELVHLP